MQLSVQNRNRLSLIGATKKNTAGERLKNFTALNAVSWSASSRTSLYSMTFAPAKHSAETISPAASVSPVIAENSLTITG